MAYSSTSSEKGNAASAAAAAGGVWNERDELYYLLGFGNSFESEALPNALPRGRNNPRNVPYHLYAEQLNGTAFTSPRSCNRRTWLYRTHPSVHGTSSPLLPPDQLSHSKLFKGNNDDNDDDDDSVVHTIRNKPSCFGHCAPQDLTWDPNPMRWKPFSTNSSSETAQDHDFVSGCHLLASRPEQVSIYVYAFGQNMTSSSSSSSSTLPQMKKKLQHHLYNSDGHFLIVPQGGPDLEIQTELGHLKVGHREIAVLPRGMMFSVNKGKREGQDDDVARGYLLEVEEGHFQLPELGPIGSNGLVNVRDVCHPVASYDATPSTDDSQQQQQHVIWNKFGGQLFGRTQSHSPFNVVAWHGNYVPFKYDLNKFCAIGSVTYDHLDPSMYTVLTVPSHGEAGTALCDFVVFPSNRIMATDSNTLRPPWFHRNVMTEFMGLLDGVYDAKQEDGFQPGGASLHSCMTPHGPDASSYQAAVTNPCTSPTALPPTAGMAFMFETCHKLKLSPFSLSSPHRDLGYATCWDDLDDSSFRNSYKTDEPPLPPT
eukprot:CAMPEP_0198303206 /NCGR_PEP_ID=MMETSP1449-20131203/56767_1 /TAXON_ID=420275 /ORGANISM="Attheya septentrionalis, Strain CCMP2084" /LENGTH=538 /DNA_ID=CAMNT_0044005693 /DNA_START=55 /DNA_END=1671 /DNA_ORIENTATION=+